ncbi:ScbA/BarX family gamma-butyrolactone biosynthesis protein [Streptomyces flavofungini]|uniref:ScbA/BarX family gamma-butyrolactone biosynthesis protein n=1 Tax=Streptomyces flavofungini TaxID=68200 RepID=UPI0034E0028D
MTVLTHQTAAAAGVPGRPTVSPAQLTTTVPREYVHRVSLAEVFLTGCRQLDGSRFALTGQWPRAHTFFTSADGLSHDFMQAAETIRQVGLFLAHAQFGVPLDHQFMLHDMEFSTDADQLLLARQPSNLDLEADCTDMVWKGGRLARFAMHVQIRREGRLAAAGSGRFTCVAPTTYRRLRGQTRLGAQPPAARPVPATPRLVGRTLSRDVVLTEADRPGRWLLSADTRHPVLFDHIGDHVPGMVLIEAARQAACALLAPWTFAPAGATTVFHRYVEYDAPCRIEAAPVRCAIEGAARVAVTGWQDGNRVFTTELTGRLS